MALPPEIVDKILKHIPTNRQGRPTLTACALVATWWTGPSQRRLFSSVAIHDDNYQRWVNNVVRSESKGHLLKYVHSLWHCRSWDPRTKHQMRDLARDSGEYLSALRNIRSLTLFNTRVENIGEKGFRICFSAFRETLTHLFLNSFTTSFSALVTLVDYFPNITTLELGSPVLEPEVGQVPSFSRPLRGKMHVHEVRDDHLEFFDQFAKLNMEYEELVIDSFFLFVEARLLESVLQISRNTVKFLRLITELECE